MTTKISTGNSGYDITFATGVDVPGFLARNLVQPLDLSLIPNLVNLGAEWQNPAYDPGNAALDAVHVVDHRLRLRHRARSPTS